MSNPIRFKRGLFANLPTLAAGEPAITTDSGAERFFIGTASGNKEVALLGNTSLFKIKLSATDPNSAPDGTSWFNGGANAPSFFPGDKSGMLYQTSTGSGYVAQIARSLWGVHTAVRTMTGGVWGSWEKLFSHSELASDGATLDSTTTNTIAAYMKHLSWDVVGTAVTSASYGRDYAADINEAQSVNIGLQSAWHHIMYFRHLNGAAGYGAQIAIPLNYNSPIRWRRSDGFTWQSWQEIEADRIGDIRYTKRTDMSNQWLLCNGEPLNTGAYPALAELTQPTILGKQVKTSSPFSPAYFYNMVYGNGYFVSANGSALLYSADGINWSSATLPSGCTTPYYVYFLNGTFVITGVYNGGNLCVIYGTVPTSLSYSTIPVNYTGGLGYVIWTGTYWKVACTLSYNGNYTGYVYRASTLAGAWTQEYSGSWFIIGGLCYVGGNQYLCAMQGTGSTNANIYMQSGGGTSSWTTGGTFKNNTEGIAIYPYDSEYIVVVCRWYSGNYSYYTSLSKVKMSGSTWTIDDVSQMISPYGEWYGAIKKIGEYFCVNTGSKLVVAKDLFSAPLITLGGFLSYAFETNGSIISILPYTSGDYGSYIPKCLPSYALEDCYAYIKAQ